jgi:hypothetical protein
MKLLPRREPGARSTQLDLRYLKIKDRVDRGVVRLEHHARYHDKALLRTSSASTRIACCSVFAPGATCMTEQHLSCRDGSRRILQETTSSFEELCMDSQATG